MDRQEESIGSEAAPTSPRTRLIQSRYRRGGGSGQVARKRSLTEHRCPLPRATMPSSARKNGSRNGSNGRIQKIDPHSLSDGGGDPCVRGHIGAPQDPPSLLGGLLAFHRIGPTGAGYIVRTTFGYFLYRCLSKPTRRAQEYLPVVDSRAFSWNSRPPGGRRLLP